jgi:hypothetical protein
MAMLRIQFMGRVSCCLDKNRVHGQGFLWSGEGHPVGGGSAGSSAGMEPPPEVRPAGLEPDDEYPRLAAHSLLCRR